LEERGFVGLEARAPDGVELGRISEMVTDEMSGEITHVIVERSEELLEVPISALSLDPESDFVIVHADASDEEPGDQVGDEDLPQDYAPLASDVDDAPHEGQFATTPTDPAMDGGDGLADEVALLLTGTGMEVRAAADGVVELTGAATSQDQLEALVSEIRGLTEVLDVDTTDVEVL
jgi:sporulation protein YlmC with PRC-barrel domain